MPDVTTYLFFSGNCAEAMRFYERTLGGKLDLMTHAEAPSAAQAPPGSANLIMHARLELDGGGVLMASDDIPGANYKGMYGFYVSLVFPDAAAAKRTFDALSPGGKVITPLQKMFWTDAFGMVIDRFGTPWMVNSALKMPR